LRRQFQSLKNERKKDFAIFKRKDLIFRMFFFLNVKNQLCFHGSRQREQSKQFEIDILISKNLELLFQFSTSGEKTETVLTCCYPHLLRKIAVIISWQKFENISNCICFRLGHPRRVKKHAASKAS